ncbi:udp-galactose transporter like [Fusarium sporotrichioides]|uniref:Udp-galactose transporter like n=1 Tax=Fusarium sporotrichioides TaxID=5514 RepID=A0A395SM72_FUSSP|nr:udp-galactose transporter like [Fusarium sporotrichioides]
MSEVSDIEKQQTKLEDDITKLKGALKHWQTWDAEYEMLKEEVLAVCESGENELKTIHAGFEGELLKDRELDEIFGERTHRSAQQILNILDRRVDYVITNIANLEKQISVAEDKLTELQPDFTQDDGLPITEIIEELDDDDNVISYKLNQPDSALPQIQQALEKAGVKDFDNNDSSSPAESSKEKESVPKAEPTPVVPKLPPKQSLPQSTEVQPTILAPSASKGVSFAEDTKMQDGPMPQVSRNAKRVEEIMSHAKEQEKITNEQAYIPEDEDEEDAELRRQMLEYSGEVGAVVAELQLEEGDSDGYEYEEYSDEGFEDDDDDQEDKYGRYTGRVVTEDYRQRMLELEQKLGIKSRFTERPEDKDAEASSDEEDGDKEEGIGRIVVKSTPSTTTPTSTSQASASKPAPIKSNIKEKQPEPTNSKKGVRFASSLDIAQESEPKSLPVREAPVEVKEPVVEPLSDIVERSTSKTSGPTNTKSTRKPSRFKKARDTVPPGPLDVPATFIDQNRPTAPTGPDGTTLADTLVEREPTRAAQPPDEFDDELILQEVADEHHKLRKKFIQREGGFLKEDESPIQPLEEQDGGRERVSRFKAAKLSRY